MGVLMEKRHYINLYNTVLLCYTIERCEALWACRSAIFTIEPCYTKCNEYFPWGLPSLPYPSFCWTDATALCYTSTDLLLCSTETFLLCFRAQLTCSTACLLPGLCPACLSFVISLINVNAVLYATALGQGKTEASIHRHHVGWTLFNTLGKGLLPLLYFNLFLVKSS